MALESYDSLESTLPDAKRYCKRDGLIWIMKRPTGRFEIVSPYAQSVKDHYIDVLGWELVAELTLDIRVEIKAASSLGS